MKTIRMMLVLFAVLLAAPHNVIHAADLGGLRISLIEGDVQFWNEEAGEWSLASINMPLTDGDRLWIPEDGRAEIQARNGSVVRLNEYTAFDVIRLDRDSLQGYLSEGQVYFNLGGTRDSMVQVDTPFSSVRSYKGAKLRLDVERAGDTEISVLSGEATVDSREGSTKLRNGERLTIGEDFADLSSVGRADSWEQWNRERDWQMTDRRSRGEYLPDELRGYSSDFDTYGRWVHVPDHGHVWTPTFSISVGWSPYRHGRWIWRGGDYVWISFEPWGWAPYHYGRWSFVASIGWCWVPPVRGAVYWGPGYVGWVSTPTYVAWIPLAPGEIYYGYGDYGPHTVNIVNVNINRTVVKHEYRNVRVKNSVTVVHHDTFVRGRHREVQVRENPFLARPTEVGRPKIRPEKESFAPVIREIPEVKRPPRLVREVKAKDVEAVRPLEKESTRPVLRPEGFTKSQQEWRRVREQHQEKDREPGERRDQRKRPERERRQTKEREPAGAAGGQPEAVQPDVATGEVPASSPAQSDKQRPESRRDNGGSRPDRLERNSGPQSHQERLRREQQPRDEQTRQEQLRGEQPRTEQLRQERLRREQLRQKKPVQTPAGQDDQERLRLEPSAPESSRPESPEQSRPKPSRVEPSRPEQPVRALEVEPARVPEVERPPAAPPEPVSPPQFQEQVREQRPAPGPGRRKPGPGRDRQDGEEETPPAEEEPWPRPWDGR